jgi:uncharacterized protein (TIGR02271 family)
VGAGAITGGAAAGAVGGALAGPVGAAAGAVIGGVAGGLTGKEVAEAIDPTAEEAYWREHYRSRPYVEEGADFELYLPAYLYGVEAEDRYRGRDFEEAEAELRKGWTRARGPSSLSWTRAREAVCDAFERTIQLREEQLRARKVPSKKGEVRVRKEVATEHQTLEVPVEREEVVVERRPVSRRAAKPVDFRAEEIRIPVRGEEVRAEKETILREEVSVGKRKVQDTAKVSGTVRKEKLRVEERGKTNVRQKGGKGRRR